MSKPIIQSIMLNFKTLSNAEIPIICSRTHNFATTYCFQMHTILFSYFTQIKQGRYYRIESLRQLMEPQPIIHSSLQIFYLSYSVFNCAQTLRQLCPNTSLYFVWDPVYNSKLQYLAFMWYFKKTAESVWNASKNLIDKRTPVQKLIDSIADCEQEILPTAKLNELSALTYEVDTFDQIVTLIFEKLKKFHYDLYESQKTLNILVATNYLIKHGATGFVDEFRKYTHMFKKYEELQPKQTYEDILTQSQLDANLEKIKSRAHHVSELLSNKEKLLKQKQLSMLVKQKLKLYEKTKLSDLQKEGYSNQQERKVKGKQNEKKGFIPEEMSVKLEGLLETYVWKYVDKLDETLESASDKVMQQIDKYVLGQNDHAQFQLEDDSEDSPRKKKNKKTKQNDDDEQLMKKIEQESKNAKPSQNVDLLQFQEVKPSPPQKQIQPVQDLI